MAPTKPHHHRSKGEDKKKRHKADEAGEDEAPEFSFLFVVNEYVVNEDIEQGGWPPQADIYGNTLPPGRREGFGEEQIGTVFRFRNGRIERATGYYWYRPALFQEGHICYATAGMGEDEGLTHVPLPAYGTYSVFNCWRLLPCLWTDVDVSATSMDRTADHKWWALHFEHDEDGVTRIRYNGARRWVSGRDPCWVPDLIPVQYRAAFANAPRSGGLGGTLGVIIGLLALTRRPGHCDEVFSERLWDKYRWSGSKQPGSNPNPEGPARGVMVHISLDVAQNEHGSTRNSIEWLENYCKIIEN